MYIEQGSRSQLAAILHCHNSKGAWCGQSASWQHVLCSVQQFSSSSKAKKQVASRFGLGGLRSSLANSEGGEWGGERSNLKCDCLMSPFLLKHFQTFRNFYHTFLNQHFLFLVKLQRQRHGRKMQLALTWISRPLKRQSEWGRHQACCQHSDQWSAQGF